MARAGVTQEEVNRAADGLLQAGERPTIERVRAVLGTGSQSTLMRLLDNWWSDVGRRLCAQEAKMALPAAPESVVLAASALWTAALADATAISERALEAARSDVARQAEALSAREQDLVASLNQANRAAAEANQSRIVAESKLAEIERLTQHQALQISDLQTQRDRLANERDSLVQRMATATEQLNKQTESAIADRQALEAQQRVHEDRWAKEIDRARQESAKLQTRLTRVEHDAGVSAREAADKFEALTAALRIIERDHASASARLTASDAEIARLHSQLALTSSAARPKTRNLNGAGQAAGNKRKGHAGLQHKAVNG